MNRLIKACSVTTLHAERSRRAHAGHIQPERYIMMQATVLLEVGRSLGDGLTKPQSWGGVCAHKASQVCVCVCVYLLLISHEIKGVCAAIEEVIPPSGSRPPSPFLTHICESLVCVSVRLFVCRNMMARSFIVTGGVLWMPSLVPGDAEKGWWIYFSRSVVYLSLSAVAAAHHRRSCVCVSVCLCVFVSVFLHLAAALNWSSARFWLMYGGEDVERCYTYSPYRSHDLSDCVLSSQRQFSRLCCVCLQLNTFSSFNSKLCFFHKNTKQPKKAIKDLV